MIPIGIWNFNRIFEAGEIHNIIQEINRHNIGILSLSELRWPNSETIKNNKKEHQNGIGFIIKNTEKLPPES